jgi:hypothetical protein
MATISAIPITDEEKNKFAQYDFISAFMPDSVPVVPPKFFDDNTIEEMIDYNMNQTELIQVTIQNLDIKNDIDNAISRDITLSPYPGYRKLNLIWAGLQDLNNYKNVVDVDMEIANNMTYIEELVRDALSEITGIQHEAEDEEEEEEAAELTDITIAGTDLEYSVAKCEEAIANFKLLYDDTDYKTYIYDAVKMKQIESEASRELLDKVAKLSNYNKPSVEEKRILDVLAEQQIVAEGAAVEGEEDEEENVEEPPATGRIPDPEPLIPEVPPVGFTAEGGSKKRKTYKRTVKRSKRSKSKRRSF